MTVGPVRAYFDEFDRTWPLARAGEADAEALRPPKGGGMGLDYILNFYRLHIADGLADEFIDAAFDEASLEVADLADAIDDLARATYGGLGVQTLVWLWADWPKRRHVHHGRLLRSGHPEGVEGLDLYDVACLMWAELEDTVTATDFVRNPPEVADKLAATLTGTEGGADSRPAGTKQDVDELRALMERGNRREAQDAQSANVAD